MRFALVAAITIALLVAGSVADESSEDIDNIVIKTPLDLPRCDSPFCSLFRIGLCGDKCTCVPLPIFGLCVPDV
uniref:Excelsatoxin A n=1 Tax=Dendrocnide excelsa TaxID=647263 RepID=NTXA_DENEC|nr:RecName: Full=Excelsatoxin A; Short=ExTxA; Flags: Precursor [Dendrocnide excelsa]QNO39340.1 excelsatoxin A peptide precursor [Dendrocnide excelsa]